MRTSAASREPSPTSRDRIGVAGRDVIVWAKTGGWITTAARKTLMTSACACTRSRPTRNRPRRRGSFVQPCGRSQRCFCGAGRLWRMAHVTYVHEATLVLIDGDDSAPGAAVTVALCGHWEHEVPCRWPHHTSSYRQGDKRIVRTVAVIPEEEVDEVTGRIRRALTGGPWTVVSQ